LGFFLRPPFPLVPLEAIASAVCKIFAAKALSEARQGKFAVSQKENFVFQLAIDEEGIFFEALFG